MKSLVLCPSRCAEVLAFLREKIDLPEECEYAMGIESDGTIVAGVVFNGWNGTNVNIHQRVAHPHAMTRSFIRTVFHFAFNVLKAARVSGAVMADDTHTINMNRKYGFRHEAVLFNYYKGRDVVHMVMRPEDCRFIQEVK